MSIDNPTGHFPPRLKVPQHRSIIRSGYTVKN